MEPFLSGVRGTRSQRVVAGLMPARLADTASGFALTLLPWSAVADMLLGHRMHVFTRDQHDRLKTHGPCGIDGQRDCSRGDAVRHVSDDEKIVTAIGIIQGFGPASLGVTNGSTTSRRFVPPSLEVVEKGRASLLSPCRCGLGTP